MNSSFGRFVGLAALSLVASTAAHAAATLVDWGTNTSTGHYYEVYAQNGITWVSANSNVQSLVKDGVRGHLVTITSEDEDIFVDGLRVSALSKGLTQNQVWIGGLRDSGSLPEFGWRWVNEGADLTEPGQPFRSNNGGPEYTNWATARGEPNNSGGNENGVTLGRYHPERSWNDEGAAVGSIGGYIVEYDLPLEGAGCSVEGGGCQTIEDQTLQFPAGSIPEGAKIGFIPFEFTDPRVAKGTCGTASLTLFGDDGVDNNELIIPPYLCGSPKFIAVRVDAEDLSITSGTVLVENFTSDALPNNVYPDGTTGSPCEDPIVQVPYTDGDPQYQDVVVWQTTDPGNMREDGSSVDPQFVGKAGEFTDSCGSSRAKTLGASYFVVGMHINFGDGYEWSVDPGANHERFVALTRYKLELLQESIEETKAEGVFLKNADYNKMKNMIANAIKNLDGGTYAGSLDHIQNFLKFVTPALYGPSAFNYEGEHISRASNIEFMLRVKVIPYAAP